MIVDVEILDSILKIKKIEGPKLQIYKIGGSKFKNQTNGWLKL